jgi:hypothetical protein
MRNWLGSLAVSGLVFVTACGEMEASDFEELRTSRAELVGGCSGSGVDSDYDGNDDGIENCLLQKHAPVLFMPRDLDWTQPANVNWYLARTHMRFHHSSCSDCQILNLGSVDQWSLTNRTHYKKGGWPGCGHGGTLYNSGSGPWNEDHTFFLQDPTSNDAAHPGSSNSYDWVTYGHVYKNALGGLNLQYWFFFPYNDGPNGFNHEGDWESIIVRLRTDATIDGVWYCEHGNCNNFRSPGQISWYDANHPYVWTADGTHASYPDPNWCNWDFNEGWDYSCQTVNAYRWFTWAGGKGSNEGFQGGGVLHVGEKEAPLNGANFLKYSGRWGEIGSNGHTSGPRSPSYQPNWKFDGYVPPPPPSSNSCAGYCGGYTGSCYCDTVCQSAGDCCPDYWSYCAYAQEPVASAEL